LLRAQSLLLMPPGSLPPPKKPIHWCVIAGIKPTHPQPPATSGDRVARLYCVRTRASR
jgi:hypothetical protein